MEGYRRRVAASARAAGRLVLACDYPSSVPDPAARAAAAVRAARGSVCGVKVNFHLLLRAGPRGIRSVTRAAREAGAQSIADVKLNDIGSTNEAAIDGLSALGFDAVIANPVMGPAALRRAARAARARGMGLVALCHMSAPEAAPAYGLRLRGRPATLHELFLGWAAAAGADGVVVGATYPGVIRLCKRRAPRMPVYSPGVGAQGGSAADARRAGADYVIAGRSVLGAASPAAEAARLSDEAG